MTETPREITLDFNHRTIAARRWGDPDGVPVLALHGWFDNCASFDRLAPLLEGIDLVAIDMAGHGRSYHRSYDANYNIWEEVEDVVGVTEALGWRRFSLLAHSRGAVASMLAAGAFPRRIERMALIDGLVPPPASAGEAPEILARAIAQRARYGAVRPREFSSLAEATEARRNGMFKLSQAAARALVERGTRPGREGLTWSSDPRLKATSTAKLTDDQVRAFLDRIHEADVPVRLVLALDGIEGMAERMQPLLQGYSNIAVREMHGGHHLHMEEGAEEIAEWFGPFLRGE
ncbi:alpha/beta hydrolase [Microbulbifer yueqingensis]|uniref:Epoxide hydrolase. Serine peptidase. MEROPS family S33 n=1 Tax=Microbulbifer yueqingensis TaxID=658219 RepID=A0A1G8V6F0_9GAMM|nr:alpha/beta fold hydrolase [Microbulbifer yueqingensis]SDJ61434.1 epoxide hydrolase. Serine peptidase. MEROPS family S33 [Microbulbifer yueqingensis]